ncbi:AgmX/PglI C-terminal domain-containing protein [Bradymonas sediminis]|nr:AgmX/PglI C-terminal domain-containing protein [Bradymonas sediminis]
MVCVSMKLELRERHIFSLLILFLALVSSGCSTQVGARAGESSATATLGDPLINGSLDDAVVRQVAGENRRDLTRCYQMGLADDRALSGQVNIRLSIAPTGGVQAALLTNSTLKNDDVETCILKEVQLWVFPTTEDGDGVEVEYPFDFSNH